MRGDGYIARRKREAAASLASTARRTYPKTTPATFGVVLMLVRTRSLIGARGKVDMKTYEFDVVLKDVSEVTEDQAEQLFAAGCDDGTPVSCAGVAWIHFDREAASLEEAIFSAVAQVQAAGFLVAKVELDVDAAAALGV
jgi:hypothetical protein